MNWNNLKENKCPKCSSLLEFLLNKYICTEYTKCGFSIGQQKFGEIVTNMYKPKVKRCATFEDNFSQLQNLGHEEDLIDND